MRFGGMGNGVWKYGRMEFGGVGVGLRVVPVG